MIASIALLFAGLLGDRSCDVYGVRRAEPQAAGTVGLVRGQQVEIEAILVPGSLPEGRTPVRSFMTLSGPLLEIELERGDTFYVRTSGLCPSWPSVWGRRVLLVVESGPTPSAKLIEVDDLPVR